MAMTSHFHEFLNFIFWRNFAIWRNCVLLLLWQHGMSPNSQIPIQPAQFNYSPASQASHTDCYFFSQLATLSGWVRACHACRHGGAPHSSDGGGGAIHRLLAQPYILAFEALLLSFSTEPKRNQLLLRRRRWRRRRRQRLLQLSEEQGTRSWLPAKNGRYPSLHSLSGQLSNLKQVQTRKNKKKGRLYLILLLIEIPLILSVYNKVDKMKQKANS